MLGDAYKMDYLLPDGGKVWFVCLSLFVHIHSSWCVCVCVPAQLKVNSPRLSDSTLKSGDWGDSGKGRKKGEKAREGGGPIPDIAPYV